MIQEGLAFCCQAWKVKNILTEECEKNLIEICIYIKHKNNQEWETQIDISKDYGSKVNN